jgi:hypothetical protein
VQRRLPQRVMGMRFAERDRGRLACGIEEHPRRTPPGLLRAVAEPVENAEETPPPELVGQYGQVRSFQKPARLQDHANRVQFRRLGFQSGDLGLR